MSDDLASLFSYANSTRFLIEMEVLDLRGIGPRSPGCKPGALPLSYRPAIGIYRARYFLIFFSVSRTLSFAVCQMISISSPK